MAAKTSQKPSKTHMSARTTRIYCTQNEHVTYEKKCIVCGKTFTAKSDKARVCSQSCQYQVKKARKKAREQEQYQIGQLTPAQKQAIKDAGGVRKIIQTPIGELTKGQKVLGWLSFGAIAWMVFDEISRQERRARLKYAK